MNLSTGTGSTPSLLSGNWLRFYEAHLTALSWPGILVPWLLSSFTFGVVQVRASQGRRGRDTGSYVDRGERREVRARAARNVKRLRRHGNSEASPLTAESGVGVIGGVRLDWGYGNADGE